MCKSSWSCDHPFFSLTIFLVSISDDLTMVYGIIGVILMVITIAIMLVIRPTSTSTTGSVFSLVLMAAWLKFIMQKTLRQVRASKRHNNQTSSNISLRWLSSSSILKLIEQYGIISSPLLVSSTPSSPRIRRLKMFLERAFWSVQDHLICCWEELARILEVIIL